VAEDWRLHGRGGHRSLRGLQVVPILDVAQPGIFAAKVGGGVLLINAAGVWVYRRGTLSNGQSERARTSRC